MRNKPIQADQLIPTSATPPPEAGFYRIDRHTIGVVGNMSFRDPNTQVMTSAVTANTDPVTGVIELSAGGAKFPEMYLSDKPVLVIGGDHTYSQWWGTNGNNGMAQAYIDRDIRPYIAVNTDADSSPDTPVISMTWEQVVALKDRGVEMIAHGHRHIMRQFRVNSGIRIRSTNGGTNTVNITSTSVVLTDTPNGTTTLLFATYPTMAQLVAAINAVPGWVSEIEDGDVFGADASAKLLPLIAARTVTATSGTQRFAICGGLTITYSGTAYQDVRVRITQGAYHNFELYCDGVRIGNFDTGNASYNTLTKLVTAIRALAITGLTVWLADNGREQTGADFPSYIQGDESSWHLSTQPYAFSIMSGETRIDMMEGGKGLTSGEILNRNYDLNKSTALANGVDLKNYAVSGYGLPPNALRGGAAFTTWRGTVDSVVQNPLWQWSDSFPQGFRLYWTAYLPQYANVNRVTAVLDALADSGPAVMDLLIHKIQPDGSSQYEFIDGGDPTYFDQVETNFITILDKIKELKDAGAIQTLTPDQAGRIIHKLPAPRNRIFNPRFRNSGESVKVADNGLVVPGWQVGFAGASFSSAGIADDALSFTTTSAVPTNILSQVAFLKPGKSYEMGFYVDIANGATGSGLRVIAQTLRGQIRNLNPAGNIIGGDYHILSGFVKMRITVPKLPDNYPGRVISKAGPFDLSVNKNIKLNINFVGQISIDCSAGAASASAVKTSEVAAAINAAIIASGTYTPEYFTCAKAVGTKVVIENPYAGAYANYTVDIAAGASADALTTVFGGVGVGMTEWSPSLGESMPWYVMLQSSMTGSATISNPYIQEIANC